MLKKAMPFIAVLLMAALCLSGCQHQHDWTQATCTEAAVCKECGETQPRHVAAQGHHFIVQHPQHLVQVVKIHRC